MPRHERKIITVCSYCRKVRPEPGGPWMTWEEYMLSYHKIETSHGICVDCAPELLESVEEKELE